MKIAILGTENSHAYAFAKQIKENPDFADVELVGVYGYDDAANQKLLNEGLASHAAKTPEEFLGKVDGVMITARHGRHHYEYGMPYIKAGVPLFIDKPFAFTSAQAAEMIAEAKKSGCLMCGGSSLRYLDELLPVKRYTAKALSDGKFMGGHVTAPVQMVNDYGNFFFYAEHLIDIMTEVFGYDIKSVSADCPDVTKNNMSVVFHYDGFDVTGRYMDGYFYSAVAYSKDGLKEAFADNYYYCYTKELQSFTDMVKTGKMHYSYEELAFPVKLIETIKEACESGRKVEFSI